jgi:hypothetical protein
MGDIMAYSDIEEENELLLQIAWPKMNEEKEDCR